MRATTILPAVLLAMLGGCGSAPRAGNGAATEVSSAAASAWNPLDACATLGKDAAAAASGSPVTSAQLNSVVPGTATTAAFSSCVFALGNGAQLMVLTRKAPDADATPAAIEAARTSSGMATPAADVPGLGKAALWSEPMNTLQVFIDDTRFVSVTYMGLPAGADARAQAIAVARKLM